MSMLSAQADELRTLAHEIDEIRLHGGEWLRPELITLHDSAQAMREAADTILSLREMAQEANKKCRIEWRDDSHDTDCGREHDGAYFCTACGKDLPYSLQSCWDDYQALVKDYGNVPPWDEKPFNNCPNCGAEVVER